MAQLAQLPLPPIFIAATIAALLGGCGARSPLRAEDDASSGPRDASSRPEDAAVDHTLPDASVPNTCDAVLDGGMDRTCDEATFGTCFRAVDGVPCCDRNVFCEGGVVQDIVICDDSCAQTCSRIGDPVDCVAFQCEWFVGGCGPGPEGSVEGPACVRPRGEACEEPSDCATGQQCVNFWVDPCAGSTCGACGAEAFFCQ
ncbi:MAG: hypothetical protein AAGF12_27100 [Myxococcota bacterium]